MKLKITALVCAMLTMSLAQAMQKNPPKSLDACQSQVNKHETAYYALAKKIALGGEKKDLKTPLLKEIEQTINDLWELGKNKKAETLVKRCVELSKDVTALDPNIALGIVASMEDSKLENSKKSNNGRRTNVKLFDLDAKSDEEQEQIAQDEELARKLQAGDSKNSDSKVNEAWEQFKTPKSAEEEKRAKVAADQAKLFAMFANKNADNKIQKEDEDSQLESTIREQHRLVEAAAKNKKTEDSDSDSDLKKLKTKKDKNKKKTKKTVDSDDEDSESEKTATKGLLANLRKNEKKQEKSDMKKNADKKKLKERKKVDDEEDQSMSSEDEKTKREKAFTKAIETNPVELLAELSIENKKLQQQLDKALKLAAKAKREAQEANATAEETKAELKKLKKKESKK